MNAESYLRKQGWRGSGHSLDSADRGIKKPLLIAHKQDQLGLGKKKAAWTTDDQWWMRAYDQSLQTIGTGHESTLHQIRTKGVNRGGLYGFFVQGEAIAGTIDDRPASVTDASPPPSGASTPPTSASESGAPARPATMSDKKHKRKRQDDDAPKDAKKVKKARAKEPEAKKLPSSKDDAAVARNIAKLPPNKKARYQQRAAAKKQTLHEYILRRIQKKAAKHARPAASSPQPAFFTDLEGDAALPQQTAMSAPALPVLGMVDVRPADKVVSALDDAPKLSAEERKAVTKAALKAKRQARKAAKKPPPGKALLREKRQAKKEAKKAIKAEKALKRSQSKWGANKAQSRWGKIKAKKIAEKAAAVADAAGTAE
ncbi:hypothetical protein BDU57DRAFT_540381 [Ampelomyces quisqualis]|uniref:G-patch domain-containing protein n=1 Tax=Ampelomyces quisqualis TaxID=50730 RepID=A0A6A5QIY9_AMPQU|nr:hypothetical protein BDU57DRAFT_540381 [Ampelomyces quisqualis]